MLLAADGPEDYERLVPEFEVGHREAMEQFPRYLAGKLGEIRLVELGLPGIDPDPILQVGQVRGGRLALVDRAAGGGPRLRVPRFV